MSDDIDRAADESQKRRRPLRVIVLTLLVLYPLSIGPVFALVDRLGVYAVIPLPLALFYLPILWLVEIIPGGQSLFEKYVGLFAF